MIGIDTNILICARAAASPWQATAAAFLEGLGANPNVVTLNWFWWNLSGPPKPGDIFSGSWRECRRGRMPDLSPPSELGGRRKRGDHG